MLPGITSSKTTMLLDASALLLLRRRRYCSIHDWQKNTLLRKVQRRRRHLPSGVRSYLTDITAPPPAEVIERPCTVILTEDIGVLHGVRSISEKSWHVPFQTHIPTVYGMSYAQWSLSEQKTLKSSFGEAVMEMCNDLAPHAHNVVLVTRGPIRSWMAQFYLENLPLAGLVMVDPLPFDNDDAAGFLFRRQYQQHYYPGNDRPVPEFTLSREFALYQDYIHHYNHWTMKLEPGVVPMIILSTNNVVWEQEHSKQMLTAQYEFAKKVAQRHSIEEGRKGPVSVIQIDSINTDACIKTICDWIVDEVL